MMFTFNAGEKIKVKAASGESDTLRWKRTKKGRISLKFLKDIQMDSSLLLSELMKARMYRDEAVSVVSELVDLKKSTQNS